MLRYPHKSPIGPANLPSVNSAIPPPIKSSVPGRGQSGHVKCLNTPTRSNGAVRVTVAAPSNSGARTLPVKSTSAEAFVAGGPSPNWKETPPKVANPGRSLPENRALKLITVPGKARGTRVRRPKEASESKGTCAHRKPLAPEVYRAKLASAVPGVEQQEPASDHAGRGR